MNERIKQLIVQSDNGQFHNGKFYPHIGSRNLKDWERFAELIIKECATVGFGVFNEEPDSPASDLQYYVRDRIKKHFGVE